MSIKDILMNHSHYWGVPHRDSKDRLVMTCYDCGMDKEVKVAFTESRENVTSLSKFSA